MGDYLSTPNKDKDTAEGANAVVSIVSTSLKYKTYLSLIDEMGFMWHAGMEKIDGRFPSYMFRCRRR